MKKIVFLSLVGLFLVACGGGSDNNTTTLTNAGITGGYAAIGVSNTLVGWQTQSGDVSLYQTNATCTLSAGNCPNSNPIVQVNNMTELPASLSFATLATPAYIAIQSGTNHSGNTYLSKNLAPVSGHKTVVFNDAIYLVYSNSVWRSNNAKDWQLLTDSASFEARGNFELIVFNKKMYFIGGTSGCYPHIHKNDIWSSNDGITWNLVVSNADFSPRGGHQVVSFMGYMYLIGGFSGNPCNDQGGHNDDVWKSNDGSSWTLVASNIGLNNYPKLTVYNDYIYAFTRDNYPYSDYLWRSSNGVSWSLVGSSVSNTLVDFPSNIDVDVFNNEIYVSANGNMWKSNNGISWAQIASHNFQRRLYSSIIAFNDELYLIGGNTLAGYSSSLGRSNNEVYQYNNNSGWDLVNLDYSNRIRFEVTNFNNKLFLTGGSARSAVEHDSNNDIYESINGSKWNLVTASASFSPRSNHKIIIFNNAMYLVGGGDSYAGPRNDIWKSTNGLNWTLVTASASFSPRYYHQVVNFKDEMYLIGDRDKKDIWKSNNGTSWTLVTNNASWTHNRNGHKILSFNNKLYSIGGAYTENKETNYLNDVWESSDGVNWTLLTSSATFAPRVGHSVVVFNGAMYLIGGGNKHDSYNNNNNIFFNDIWKSTNGVSWTLITNDSKMPLLPVVSKALVFDSAIYVFIGVTQAGSENQIWKSIDGINWRLLVSVE